MEPISAIALSLALGAGATAGKEVVSSLVKDAYSALKSLLNARYPNVQTERLEVVPGSIADRASAEAALAAANAGRDAEVVSAAMKLIDLVQQQTPTVAAAIGVDLKDVSAASLLLTDIAAVGTGVKVEHGTFTGDIEIRGVHAGHPTIDPVNPWPKGR
jgi:hypothetical protein